MAIAHADQPATQDRLIDVVGRAAHVAHEARVLKTMAADAIEDGVHAAKRAVTRSARDIEDLRDAAAYRVKKAPLMAVALAAAAGLALGIGVRGVRTALDTGQDAERVMRAARPIAFTLNGRIRRLKVDGDRRLLITRKPVKH